MGKSTRKRFPGFNPNDGAVAIDNDVIDFVVPYLGNAEFKVYLQLCYEHEYNGSDVFPASYPYLAQRTGLGRSTVMQAVWLLYARRLIDKEAQAYPDGRTAPNLFRLLPIPEEMRQ
jgi:predicted transcriptional regulator